MVAQRSMSKRGPRGSGFSLSTIMTSKNVQVFVGKESREFLIDRDLLASCSSYFREKLDATAVLKRKNAQFNILWLEDQDPEMFELFTYWLQQQRDDDENGDSILMNEFKALIDDALLNDYAEDLVWDLVSLHLFGAHINMPVLQDSAMDAIQDMHLQCNWDISSRLVRHAYMECSADASCRLRKWIVAMTAWTLGGGMERPGTAEQMQALFQACPDFLRDYVAHISKISKSRVRIATKNPQLRLPSNNLRNEERQFGFRQCSFHTHRSLVKQGRCPHVNAQLLQHMHRKVLPPTPLVLRSPVSDVVSDSSESEYDESIPPSLHGMSPRFPRSPRSSSIFELYLGMI